MANVSNVYFGDEKCFLPGIWHLRSALLSQCKNELLVQPTKKERRQKSEINTSKYLLPRTPYGKVTKSQENIINKKAKLSALFKQVTTRLQETD